MPLATRRAATPGTARAFCISSMSGPWSVPSSLQIVGCTHDSRRHFASTSGFVQRIWYMFAVGPPMSLTVPLNFGSAASASTSLSTDSCERDWMMRPWWAVIEQNVQPPKQPRMIVTESLIIS